MTNQEDALAKYERVLISSLFGYALYLKKSSNVAEDSSLSDDSLKSNLRIVGNEKFWKLGKKNEETPSSSKVLCSWLSLLSVLLQKAPSLLDGRKKNVCECVFGRLDDSDPSVLVLVWEAALLIVTKIEVGYFFLLDYRF